MVDRSSRNSGEQTRTGSTLDVVVEQKKVLRKERRRPPFQERSPSSYPQQLSQRGSEGRLCLDTFAGDGPVDAPGDWPTLAEELAEEFANDGPLSQATEFALTEFVSYFLSARQFDHSNCGSSRASSARRGHNREFAGDSAPLSPRWSPRFGTDSVAASTLTSHTTLSDPVCYGMLASGGLSEAPVERLAPARTAAGMPTAIDPSIGDYKQQGNSGGREVGANASEKQRSPTENWKQRSSRLTENLACNFQAEIVGPDQELLMWQRPPLFTFLQVFGSLVLWLALAEGSADVSWAESKSGLESTLPGETLMLLHRGCTDHRHEAWRWFSYQFTHVGLMHICPTAIMGLALGIPLEGFHGTFRTMALFNIGVFGGACLHVVTDAHSGLAGMSGGCYGLLGMHFADLIMNWSQKRFRRPTLLLLLFLAAVDILMALVNSPLKNGQKVSNAAHIGGYLVGFLSGVVICRNLVVTRRERALQLLAGTASLMLPALCVWWATALWPPRSLLDPNPWCLTGLVTNETIFGDSRPRCVHCDSQTCIDELYGHISRVFGCQDWEEQAVPVAAPSVLIVLALSGTTVLVAVAKALASVSPRNSGSDHLFKDKRNCPNLARGTVLAPEAKPGGESCRTEVGGG